MHFSLGTADRPVQGNLVAGQVVLAAKLERVQVARLVAVRALLLDLVAIARIQALLETGAVGAARDGHAHQGELVELVQLVAQVEEGIPTVRFVGALVRVVVLDVEGVGALDGTGGPAGVDAVLVRPGVAAVLGAEDVTELAAEEGGLVAEAQGVLHVHGSAARHVFPRVAEALSDVSEILVGGDGGGNAGIEVKRVGEGWTPLVGVAQAVEDAVAVREVGDVPEAAEAAAHQAAVEVFLADPVLVEQVLDLVTEGDVDQGGPIVGSPAVHEGGQCTGTVVVAEPVGAAALAGDDVFSGGVGVEAEAGAVVEGEGLREILGLHGDVGTGPVRGQVGRLGLHHHEVVHEVGGEEVHFNGVAARVDGGDFRPVEGGLEVPVGQAADKHEVADGGDARDALHGAGGIVVSGALDLLAGDVVDAGGGLLLDVLHVDVAGAVHLGHHFGCLFDDEGLGEQVEVHDDDFVPGDGH